MEKLLSLTRESKKRLNHEFNKWWERTDRRSPEFGVIANVCVKTGKVKIRFCDKKQFNTIQRAINRAMGLKSEASDER